MIININMKMFTRQKTYEHVTSELGNESTNSTLEKYSESDITLNYENSS